MAPFRAIRRKVVEIADLSHTDRILDVACGTGEQAIAFANAGCSVVGIDLCEAMILRAKKKAKQLPSANFFCQDASSLPFPDESFDVTTVSLALHDMPRSMALRILMQMQRVTKFGGKIIIVEHERAENFFGDFVHRHLLKHDTEYYADYISSGLNSYLSDVPLTLSQNFTCMFGIIRITVCHRD